MFSLCRLRRHWSDTCKMKKGIKGVCWRAVCMKVEEGGDKQVSQGAPAVRVRLRGA